MAYSTAPLEIAFSLNIMALNGAFPDKIILLELSKNELEKRLNSKENDSIESRGADYLLDIQNRMKESLTMAQTASEKKIDVIIIDASKSIDDISKEIEAFLEK